MLADGTDGVAICWPMQAEIGCTARLAARWDMSGHLVVDLRLNPLVEECSR